MASISQPLGLFETLRGVEVFQDFSDADLLAWVPHFTLRFCRKGEVVMNNQSPAAEVFILCSGRLTLHAMGQSGKKVVVRSIGESEIFGDTPLLEGHGACVSITADSKSVLVGMGQQQFTQLITQHPLLALRHMRKMASALSTMTQRVSGFMSLTAPVRVQQVLLEFAKSSGEGLCIKQLPKHSEIAVKAYTQREVVNKELNRLIRSGVIVKGDHEFFIPQPSLLEAFQAAH
ncbi:MAG: Crp/Fnr family transcriptional regulator [Limnobacter sp.]|nr:Crp/Fnr family transcriptional regulator [Limnobacter sp.]